MYSIFFESLESDILESSFLSLRCFKNLMNFPRGKSSISFSEATPDDVAEEQEPSFIRAHLDRDTAIEILFKKFGARKIGSILAIIR